MSASIYWLSLSYSLDFSLYSVFIFVYALSTASSRSSANLTPYTFSISASLSALSLNSCDCSSILLIFSCSITFLVFNRLICSCTLYICFVSSSSPLFTLCISPLISDIWLLHFSSSDKAVSATSTPYCLQSSCCLISSLLIFSCMLSLKPRTTAQSFSAFL